MNAVAREHAFFALSLDMSVSLAQSIITVSKAPFDHSNLLRMCCHTSPHDTSSDARLLSLYSGNDFGYFKCESSLAFAKTTSVTFGASPAEEEEEEDVVVVDVSSSSTTTTDGEGSNEEEEEEEDIAALALRLTDI
jgi:hypothetical protein